MLEFILAIPLLAMVIAATFFFGTVMRNQQRLRVADRYIAWDGRRSGGHVNSTFFSDRGQDVRFQAGTGPTETLEDLAHRADGVGPDAGNLAERTLLVGDRRFPRNRWRRVRAEFPREIAALQRIRGGVDGRADPAVRRHCAREGNDWRRRQASLSAAVLDLYLSDFDDVVHQNVGDSVGGAMQRVYRRGW